MYPHLLYYKHTHSHTRIHKTTYTYTYIHAQARADDAWLIFDIFFLVAFSIEIVIKTTAMGLIMPRGAYLRNTWNRLDFMVGSMCV
jgi:hypothetical protein